jgi:hypothetical protein
MSVEDPRTPTPHADPPAAAGRAVVFGRWVWAPWVIAACLAVISAWLLNAYVSTYGDLVSAQSEAAMRKVEGKAIQQQLEAERILNARRLVDLLDEFHAQNDPAQYHVVPLVSGADPRLSPPAFVVWNSNRQEGELVGAGIPKPPPDKDYQLWITDAENLVAVSAAVFTVDTMSGGFRVPFKFTQLRPNAGFTVSLERKGGAASRQGNIILSSR